MGPWMMLLYMHTHAYTHTRKHTAHVGIAATAHTRESFSPIMAIYVENIRPAIGRQEI